jgi:SAM-dependent methyltransferase
MDSRRYRSFEEVDWDFAVRRSGAGWGRWHWYPARMAEGIADVLVGVLTETDGCVLDPFCGSGSVLTSGYSLGRRAEGVDLNPVACLITEAKLVPAQSEHLAGLADTVRDRTGPLFASDGALDIPNGDRQIEWYHEDTLRELGEIHHLISRLDDKGAATVALACFSAILWSCSSPERHWGWVCDNVRPESPAYRPAFELFIEKIDLYLDLRRRLGQRRRAWTTDEYNGKVVCGDAARVLTALDPGSVDAVITSPPYFSTTDYLASQRLTLLWDADSYIRERGDTATADYRNWRAQEIGARYKRGGATARDDYMTSMRAALAQCHRVLRTGGHLALVLGESRSRQGVLDDLLGPLPELGFDLIFRTSRKIPNTRQLAGSLHQEEVFVYRRV